MAFQHNAFQDNAWQDGVAAGAAAGTQFYTRAGTMRAMGRRHRVWLLWLILGSRLWL